MLIIPVVMSLFNLSVPVRLQCDSEPVCALVPQEMSEWFYTVMYLWYPHNAYSIPNSILNPDKFERLKEGKNIFS